MYGSEISDHKLNVSVQVSRFFPDQYPREEVNNTLVAQRLADLGLNQYLVDRLIGVGYDAAVYNEALVFSITKSATISNNLPTQMFYRKFAQQTLEDSNNPERAGLPDRLFLGLIRGSKDPSQVECVFYKTSEAYPKIMEIGMASLLGALDADASLPSIQR